MREHFVMSKNGSDKFFAVTKREMRIAFKKKDFSSIKDSEFSSSL